MTRSPAGTAATCCPPPATLEGHDLIIDLGPVDDVDFTYLNGRVIGGTGRLPGQGGLWLSAWNQPRRYRVPSDLVRWGEKNAVAVKVYDEGGLGGIQRQPVFGFALVPQDGEWEVVAAAAVAPAFAEPSAGRPNSASASAVAPACAEPSAGRPNSASAKEQTPKRSWPACACRTQTGSPTSHPHRSTTSVARPRTSGRVPSRPR